MIRPSLSSPFAVLNWPLCLTLAVSLSSCRDGDVEPAQSADSELNEPSLPQPLAFEENTPQLLLSVLDSSGQPQTFEHPAEVPQDLRQRVMVVDLSKTPEQRQADRFVFFADLQQPDAQGKYHARPMSRFRKHAPTATGADTDPSTATGVTVYTAPWCGFCKKAKAYLKKKGVPFVERDVEGSAAAARELEARLRAAGAAGGGVPVIDIDGQLIMGFDQAQIDKLLSQRSGAEKKGQPVSATP